MYACLRARVCAVVAREEALEINRRLVTQLVVAYFSKRQSREDVLDVLATTLQFTEEEKVTCGILTQWDVEQNDIREKAASKDSGFSFSDAWTTFLSTN
eukprot:COSAG05_NODE_59_length_23169_cov_37.393698_11_plen_99_part_00